MTLKFRFSLSFVLYTMLVLALFGGTYYVIENRTASRMQEEEQINSIEKIASVCAEMSMTENIFVATNYFGVIKREPWLAYVECVGPSGLIQAHSDPKLIGRGVEDPEVLKILAASEVGHRRTQDSTGAAVLEWHVPVIGGTKKIGTALAAYREEVLRQNIHKQLVTTLRQLALVSSSTFILAILASLILSGSLSRPIDGLAEAARAFGAGNFDYRTPIVERNDELGVLARELNDMARKLKSLDDMKDQFISHVSHDLRSPMASIRMYVDYMIKMEADGDTIPPEQRRILSIISHNASRLSNYVSNILDTAKIRAGRMEYYSESVAAEPILKSVQELYVIVAQQLKIRFAVKVPPQLPKIMVDPQRFEQVVANLVSNSFKFTRSGGTVEMGAVAGDGFVDVYVSDTGSGIKKELLEHLFTPFYQTDVAEQRTKRIQGTGLGLFIVRETVTAMGGQITVASEYGKGTRFTIRFPAKGDNHGKT